MGCALLLSSASTRAQPGTEAVSPAVAECVRTNMKSVEEAVSSLPDAADFLVNKLCAAPLAQDVSAREQKALEKIQKDASQSCGKQKDDKTCVRKIGFAGEEQYLPSSDPAAEATSMAAKLLLDARLARLRSKH